MLHHILHAYYTLYCTSCTCFAVYWLHGSSRASGRESEARIMGFETARPTRTPEQTCLVYPKAAVLARLSLTSLRKGGTGKKKSREKQKGKERKGKKEEKKRERMNQRKKKRSDTREHLLTNLHYSFPPGTLRVAMRSSEALVHPQIGGTYWLGFRQGQRVRRRNSRQQLCSPLQKHVSRGVA